MKKPTAKKENQVSKPSELQISKAVGFPIAGIGASAGGLEALEHFFTNVPVNSGIALWLFNISTPAMLALCPNFCNVQPG